jgi:plasmid stability protein
MATIQIKNVPEETYTVLRQRAALAHQSLQKYLLGHLIEVAGEPTINEILYRAGGRSGGSVTLKASTSTVRANRDSH